MTATASMDQAVKLRLMAGFCVSADDRRRSTRSVGFVNPAWREMAAYDLPEAVA